MKHFDHLVNIEYKEGHKFHGAAKRSREVFKNKAFTATGEHVLPTLNDAYLSMTCKPCEGDPDWMVPYECVLGQCDACPKLALAPGEDTKTTNNPVNKVKYKENAVEYHCESHGFVGYKRKCLGCDDDEVPSKDRKIKSVQAVVYKSCSIHDFMTDILPKQLRAYSQHRFHFKCLGKSGCLGERLKCLTTPGDVLVHRDYMTKVAMEFSNAVMGIGMGGTPTVGMEAMLVNFIEVVDIPEELGGGTKEILRTHWLGFLSDEQQQDSRTSMTNTNKMIHRMRSLGNLSTDEHKILMVSDGCRKQYKCANAIAAQIMTTEGFNVTINNMILCEYHGKSSVDALAGVDKNKLRNCLISDFDNATRDDDNKIVSQAHVCKGVLSDESRRYGLNTDSKHKHHEGQGKVDERWYESPIMTRTSLFP